LLYSLVFFLLALEKDLAALVAVPENPILACVGIFLLLFSFFFSF